MKRESLKANLSLVIVVAALVTPIAWFGFENPYDISPWLRYVVPILGIIALVFLLKIHFGKDKVPNFFDDLRNPFFERNGFCFTLVTVANDGVCWLEVYFQNKYERPCEARMVVKTSFNFLVTTNKIESLNLTIPCGPAAFGVTSVPWPILQKYQGKLQRLNVGVKVKYPRGRGRILRYKDGLIVGKPNFHNKAWVHILQQLVRLCTLGMLSPSKPASAEVLLPENVMDDLPDGLDIETKQLWQLGDDLPEQKYIIPELPELEELLEIGESIL